jgi:Protein of unknown function (DUF3892)
MTKYLKARPGPKNSVIYTDSNGKDWQFIGGNRPWRNQNPGDMRAGAVSKRNGAIGKAGGFAVFPNYKSGHAALLDLLKTNYKNFDIPQLMEAYAPKSENPTERYIAFIRKKTGIKDDKQIKAFSPTEFNDLWKAIEQMEGWNNDNGSIKPLSNKKKILGVKKDKKGTILAYQIQSYGWVTKSQGIRLTLAGKVDAVVSTSPNGNQFLRARPNSSTTDNLDNLG